MYVKIALGVFSGLKCVFSELSTIFTLENLNQIQLTMDSEEQESLLPRPRTRSQQPPIDR